MSVTASLRKKDGSTVEFEHVWCTIEYEGCTISSKDAGMASQCQLPCIQTYACAQTHYVRKRLTCILLSWTSISANTMSLTVFPLMTKIFLFQGNNLSEICLLTD